MVSDERALAVRLASTEDDALARTFAERGVAASAPWHDFFDAAAGMLDPASVERAVARLPRTSLVALFAALDGASLPASELAVLRPLALVGDDGAPFGAVATRVRAASIARPDAFVAEPPAPPVVAAEDSDAAAAAERAFTTVGALADVLLAGLHTPLSRTGTGAVSAIDRRRLTDAGALGSVDDIDDLVAAAAAADLVTPLGREWIVTDGGTQWLEATTTRRWAVIAPEGTNDASSFEEGCPIADGREGQVMAVMARLAYRPLADAHARLLCGRRRHRAPRLVAFAAPHLRDDQRVPLHLPRH